MPQNYNVPEWFTHLYREEMKRVLDELRTSFAPKMSIGALLVAISDSTPGQNGIRLGASMTNVVWWGQESNIGEFSLFSLPPELYRELFPYAATDSIEVFEKGPSLAEESNLTLSLAQSLAVEYVGLARLKEVSRVFSDQERLVLCHVLKVISLRTDDAGKMASRALLDFWQN